MGNITYSDGHIVNAFEINEEMEVTIKKNGYVYKKDDDRIPTAPEGTAPYWYMYVRAIQERRKAQTCLQGGYYSGSASHSATQAINLFEESYVEWKKEQRILNIEKRLDKLESKARENKDG